MPEINITPREATRMMEMYSVFILDYGYKIDEIAQAKTKSLHYILPLAKSQELDKEKIDELVSAAVTLTQNDFKERYYDIKTNEKGERTYTFMIMKKCNETGTLTKIHDIESEQIKQTFNLI